MNKLVTLSGRAASQKFDELTALTDRIVTSGCKSYLEVGTRHGDTFYHIMKALPKDTLGVALDLPGGLWGKSSTEQALRRCIDQLKAEGYHRVRMVLGDSTSPEIIEQVRALGPYDAMLIDGDHRYEGVKQDWLNYGQMAQQFVAFHDIAGEGIVHREIYHVEVPRLWREIKQTGKRVEEFVSVTAPDKPMGIGIVYTN